MMWKALLFGLASTLVACASGGEAARQDPAGRPNILLIVADDLGYSEIGPFGAEIATPTVQEIQRRTGHFARSLGYQVTGNDDG